MMNNHRKTPDRKKQSCGLDDDGPESNVKDWIPFPVDKLPDPLPIFVHTSAKSIGCDEALIVSPLLAGLAAAIGTCRIVQLKDDGDPWFEPSILWTISVAGSGSKKTPALNLTKNRFRGYERRQAANADSAQVLSVQKEFERQTEGGDDEMKNDCNAPDTAPEQQKASSIIVCDTTVEGLASRLKENPKGLLLLRDELNGWIKSLGRYTKSDTPFYLEAYQAGSYSVLRKTRGTMPIQFRR